MAEIDEQDKIIPYKLGYKNLEVTVIQAYMHFGQWHAVSGIMIWLCQADGTRTLEAIRELTPDRPPEGTASTGLAATITDLAAWPSWRIAP